MKDSAGDHLDPDAAPYCAAIMEGGGYRCTEGAGHDGSHIAVIDGLVRARWANRDPWAVFNEAVFNEVHGMPSGWVPNPLDEEAREAIAKRIRDVMPAEDRAAYRWGGPAGFDSSRFQATVLDEVRQRQEAARAAELPTWRGLRRTVISRVIRWLEAIQ